MATSTLELLEDEPSIDVIVVPIGGGSGAAAACIAGKAVRAGIEVIGVQSDAAPAAFRTWKEGRPVEDRMETFAEGLATRTSFELPQRIMREQLDDFILVSDDEIRAAMVAMIETTRNLVEAAGAAAAGRRAALARAARGKARGARLQRRQHQRAPARRRARARRGPRSASAG